MEQRDRAWRVLDHAKQFHQRLRQFYQNLSEAEKQPRVKLLLEYFADHEENIERIITSYEKGAPRAVLDSWFECLYDECRLSCFEKMDHIPNMTVEQVIELAMKADACIETNYRRLIESDKEPEVRQFFSQLLQLEISEKKKAIRNSQQIVDL